MCSGSIGCGGVGCPPLHTERVSSQAAPRPSCMSLGCPKALRPAALGTQLARRRPKRSSGHTHERALLSHGEFTCLLILHVPQAHHRRRRSLRLWHSGTATSPRLHRLRLTWYADSPELQTRLPSHCTPPPPAHAHACRATRTLHTDEVPTVVRADGSWHCWRCTSSFSLLGTLNALRPYHDKPPTEETTQN